MEKKITGKQKRYLRGLGNQLKPSVIIGKAGLTKAIILTTKEALEANELIKCRILETCDENRKIIAKNSAEQSDSELVQVLGRTFLLYKANNEKSIIELPRIESD